MYIYKNNSDIITTPLLCSARLKTTIYCYACRGRHFGCDVSIQYQSGRCSSVLGTPQPSKLRVKIPQRSLVYGVKSSRHKVSLYPWSTRTLFHNKIHNYVGHMIKTIKTTANILKLIDFISVQINARLLTEFTPYGY